jgi:glycosyltransferase involved in cell wall biosynthesis
MRLAVVVNSFPALSESFIFRKVIGLRERGVDVTVLANSRRNDRALFATQLAEQEWPATRFSPLAAGAARLPLALAPLLTRQAASASRLLAQATKCYGRGKRALRAWALALPLVAGGYNLIHFTLSGLAVSYRDALPLLKPAKLLVSCRGTGEQITPLLDPARADELRHMFAAVNRVHCVSAEMRGVVEQYGVPKGRAFVNHPAIDATLFRRSTPYRTERSAPLHLLSVGRLHWVKGLEYALLAMQRLANEGLTIHYTIIGGGPEEERLRFMVSELGLGEHVYLAGRQPAEQVRAALEQADIYLLSSLSEGLSNAALEAMAMELPVVATDVGGMAEAITDGLEGLLVPPYAPELIAAGVRTLASDAGRRRTMGKAGRRRVEAEFSLTRQIDVFVHEYRELLDGGERS